MGKNFLILFDEKEGSTPIVRLMDNFSAIDIVRQASNRGWEPFDLHCCGPISMHSYLRCLDLIYGGDTPYMEELNRIYTATARYPLRPFDKDKSRGLKMRFHVQRSNRWLHLLLGRAFRHFSIDRFRANDVVVFVTVRQDVLRWALSKYHGDGTGQPGHLQFKLATRQINRSQIPKIRVELNAFRQVLSECERLLVQKRELIAHLQCNGVATWPMLYESFCDDKGAFFAEVLSRLNLAATEHDIATALEKGTRYQKVHSHDIGEFVVNADEVLEEFGERYVKWQGA